MKEEKLDRELRFHMEEQVRDYVAQGMSEVEARRRARLEFGAMEQIKDECRDQRPLSWLADLWMDVRYGLRQLARTPFLAASVVAMLTFGLGLNASVFTFINAELFRAHVPEPESFLSLEVTYRIDGQSWERASLDDFEAMRAAVAGVADLTAVASAGQAWLGGSDAIAVGPQLVSCNYFAVYGLDRPLLGRAFNPADCANPGGSAIAVLSEGMWRDRFDADPGIVGKPVNLNRVPFVVAGIAPSDFAGTNRGSGVWIPYTAQPLLQRARTRIEPWIGINGRLKPGHTRGEVQAAARVVAAQQDRLNPRRTTRVEVTSGSSARRIDLMVAFIIASALLVLVGVCVNVALLLLSRADARRREVSVRLSLGASRSRLLRMLLTETLLLAITASAISAWITTWLPLWVYKYLTDSTPNYSMAPNWLSFAWLAGVTLLSAVLAGVAPGMESLKVDLISAMKGSARVGGSRTRGLLMGTQAAVSLVLLVLAGMFADSAARKAPVDEGLDTRQITLTRFVFRSSAIKFPLAFQRDVGERLRALPQVKSVAFVDFLRVPEASYVTLPARVPVTSRMVSPDYFRTVNIHILQGRSFTAADTSGVAVVSAQLAAALWPGQNPLGKTMLEPGGKTVEVVGVAANCVAGFFNATEAQFYQPLPSDARWADMLIHFDGSEQPMLGAIRGLAREQNPELIPTTRTLEGEYKRGTLFLAAFVQVITALGAVTLFVSMAGLYGVVSYSVSRRFRELGIRTAIGATRANIFGFVMSSGSRPLIPGLLAGLAIAFGASHALAKLLAKSDAPLRAGDPVVFGSALGLLMLAALLAMIGPARRATRCDPVRALREE